MSGAPEVWEIDRWPQNAPAWHSLTDAQVVRAVRHLRAHRCACDGVSCHCDTPGKRRWRLAAALWQAEYRNLMPRKA